MNILVRNNMDLHSYDPDAYDFESCFTFMYPDNGIHEPDIVAALIKHQGNFSAMARDLGRTRTQVENCVKKSPELNALYDEIRETLLDVIEYGTLSAAISGDKESQRFVLKTLGKDRGFITREERTGANGAPLHAPLDTSEMSDEVMEQLMNARDRQLKIAVGQ